MLATGGQYPQSKDQKAVIVQPTTMTVDAAPVVVHIAQATIVLVAMKAMTMIAHSIQEVAVASIVQKHLEITVLHIMQMETAKNIQKLVGQTVFVTTIIQTQLTVPIIIIQEHITVAALYHFRTHVDALHALVRAAKHATHNT